MTIPLKGFTSLPPLTDDQVRLIYLLFLSEMEIQDPDTSAAAERRLTDIRQSVRVLSDRLEREGRLRPLELAVTAAYNAVGCGDPDCVAHLFKNTHPVIALQVSGGRVRGDT